MMEAYRCGDPYLAFAKQAGAVPADATKSSHRDQRERFKHGAIGVQYGMGAESLAARLGAALEDARDVLHLHRRTYPAYWRWSNRVERQARKENELKATLGWTLHVGPDANPRSLRNFPLQANGSEMLRLACIALTEAGVRICAPVHDALLIEAPAADIEATVAVCREAMGQASEVVLGGFRLRTDVKTVHHPERYSDERGRTMWKEVFALLDREGVAPAQQGCYMRATPAQYSLGIGAECVGGS
jgi:DNA polymerase-1